MLRFKAGTVVRIDHRYNIIVFVIHPELVAQSVCCICGANLFATGKKIFEAGEVKLSNGFNAIVVSFPGARDDLRRFFDAPIDQ
jgi:hypothetical protein